MGINLHTGETLQSDEPAVLYEVQRQRGRSGEWVGANVRVLKGLTLRVGTFDSHQSNLPAKTIAADSGRLYRTNQRVVFLGATTEVEIEARNILSEDDSGGRLTIFVHGRETPYVFSAGTGITTGLAVLDGAGDPLLSGAVSVISEYDLASASLLQRRLKIGYARAARMIDQLEAIGYLGPFEGSNARRILRREPLTTTSADHIDSPMTPAPRSDKDLLAGSSQAVIAVVQRLSEAASQILETRPKDWEYRYFAFILLMQLEELAGKYRDHELRTPRPSGDGVSMADAPAYTIRATNELAELEKSFVALRSPNTWKTEVGAPDRPGDPERIRSLATSLTAVYEGLMDWAARIRGVNRPAELESLFLMLARFADRPIEFYRESLGVHDRSTDDASSGDSSAKDPGAEKVHRGIDEALAQSYLQEMRRLFPGP